MKYEPRIFRDAEATENLGNGPSKQYLSLFDAYEDFKAAQRQRKKDRKAAAEKELATLTQQVADYKEALRYIGEVCSFGPPSAAKSECYKTARAALDKYPQTTKG
jgi:hypothetical protein